MRALTLSDPAFLAKLKPAGLDGLVLTYSIGLAGAPNWGSDGSAGGETTVTFNGTTITAYGGQGGKGASDIAYGGSYSGGDGGQTGGGAYGGYSTWSKGGPGGGAIGGTGGNDGGYYYGGHGAATADGGTNIIAQFLSPAGIDYSSYGWGNTDAGYSADGFGCGGGGGGGPGASGGYGGNGKLGGGGGGATSGQGTASGGYGGGGCVLIRRTLGDGSFAYVQLTGGNTWTVPSNTKAIKVWAIGGGGAGASVYGSPQTVGGGGGAGGICYKTWSA